MSSKFDAFEKGLRSKMDGFEVPYEDGSWEDLQSRMGSSTSGGNSLWLVAASVIGALLVAGGFYFTNLDEEAYGSKAGKSQLTLANDSFGGIRLKTEEYILAQDIPELISETPSISGDSRPTIDHNNNNAAEMVADATSADEPEVEAAPIEEETAREEISLPAMGNKPAIPISISAREGCVGTEVEFVISAASMDDNYLWNFGDGNFSNEPNPKHTYNKEGTYDITLSVTSSNDGVIRTKTMDNLIVINPQPEADFDWEFEDTMVGVPNVKFRNLSNKAEKAEWVIADEFSSEINPAKQIDKKGAHAIELVVSNEFGCSDKVTKTIEINADYSLLAPTKFSPNDDGVFDYFMPRGLLDIRREFTLKVMDENQVVFQTSNSNESWNGQLPDGSMVIPGEVYTWSAVVEAKDGAKYYSGTITITP